MLAQRPYIYICRVCLRRCIRPPQCRRLTELTDQSTPAPDKNVAPISQVDKEGPIRRVPLRELLAARRRGPEASPPEPLDKSASGGQKIEEENVQQIHEVDPSSSSKNSEYQTQERSSERASTEAHISGTVQQKSSKHPPLKFPTTFFQPGTSLPSVSKEADLTSPEISKESPQSLQDNEGSNIPGFLGSTQAQDHEKPLPEPIQSRRSRALEKSHSPIPSAPATRLRHKPPPVTRKLAATQTKAFVSPLARAYQVTQGVPDSKIHPGDPLFANSGYNGSAVREIVTQEAERRGSDNCERIWSEDIEMKPIQPPEFRPVPTLEHGLDRVLFNPGVAYLRDPRSLVYNFDPYLENIMPTTEFDYDALFEYITSSRDTTLTEIARKCGATYVGSTSSMTAVLSHFHFLLSAWRPVNIEMLSTLYTAQFRSFTAITRAPAGIFLRYKDGIYAIDADKMYDTEETVLSWLGRSMEKMLTLPPEQMEKFRKDASHTLKPHERGQPEAYHYTQCGTMLMRSQLDCNDARLPGTGVFDLKTRACIAVRMDVQHSEEGADYEIHHRTGVYNSFEREYYDMIRSAFLKYSLQVRIGKMDGIFVAYHNTKRIFGFQYIPLEEMDVAIHGVGDADIGRREFQFSVKLLNETLDRAVRRFPKQSLRLTFETRDTKVPQMYIFAEPYDEHEIDAIQNGEYIQAVRLAEERARAEKAEKEKVEAEKVEAENSVSVVLEPTASDSVANEVSIESGENYDANDAQTTGEEVTTETKEVDVLTPQTPDRELLAMVLKTQNYINGKQISGSPEPKAEDRWEMTFTFETYSPDRGRRLFQMSEDRRRKAFDDEFREQVLENSDTAQKAKEWSRGFLMHLKDLSARGKKWRGEFEETFESKEKVVWKQETPPSNFGTMAWREHQESDKVKHDSKE